jgi:hypothetical protein
VTPGADRPDGDGSATSPTPSRRAPARAPRRLSLGDPLDGRASEDRPESWGDPGESEDDLMAHYRTQKPPHHGG